MRTRPVRAVAKHRRPGRSATPGLGTLTAGLGPGLRSALPPAGLTVAALYLYGAVRASANGSNAAQWLAGAAAAAGCFNGAWRTSGRDRLWRVLLGGGMVGWTVGQTLYGYYRYTYAQQMPSPSWADAGYLTLPGCALFALTVLVSDERDSDRDPLADALLRSRIALMICSIIVSGAVFVVTWPARGVVGHSVSDSVAVGTIYLITDTILVAMAGLLAASWRVPARLRPQLRVLAGALVCLAVSDGLYAYLLTLNREQFPPTDLGFVLGPLLIAVAGARVTRPAPGAEHFLGPARPERPPPAR